MLLSLRRGGTDPRHRAFVRRRPPAPLSAIVTLIGAIGLERSLDLDVGGELGTRSVQDGERSGHLAGGVQANGVYIRVVAVVW